VYGTHADYAQWVQAYLELQLGVNVPVVADSAASDSLLAAHDLFVIGTPAENRVVRAALAQAPFTLFDDRVEIQGRSYAGSDIRAVFTAPHPYDTGEPRRVCLVYTAQTSERIPGVFTGFSDLSGWDFAVRRHSDGVWLPEDGIAAGRGDAMTIDSLAVWKKDPRRLARVEGERVTIHYDTLAESDVQTIARLLDTYCEAIHRYHLLFPERVTVYIYADPADQRKPKMYTDALSTFWCFVHTTAEDFLSPDGIGIIGFAHEMARIAFQPSIGDREKFQPFSRIADDWSHFYQFDYLIPAVWERLGADAWPVPYDYNTKWGRERFLQIYAGAENTYAWLLHDIAERHGIGLIVEHVNRAKRGRAAIWTPIEPFMRDLIRSTGEPDLMLAGGKAYPTTLEHTCRRRIHPFGFEPKIDDMFWDNDFAVVSVAQASDAYIAGMRAGDVIVGINGFDLATAKATAHRSLLQTVRDDGTVMFKIRREGESVVVSLKVKRR
jgi:hypothetical protein